MIKFVVFIMFSCITSFGQNIKLGFDLEAHQIRVISPNDELIMGGNGAPLSYHLNFALDINEKLTLLVKGGRTLHVEFSGWELGLNTSYKIFDPMYIKLGILHHSNEGGAISNQLYVTFASILMVQLGIGVDVANFLSIGLDYYIPTSKKVIYWTGLFEKEPRAFTSMIRLGFNFGWDL